MGTARTTCPACQAVVAAPDAKGFGAGQVIACPLCGELFDAAPASFPVLPTLPDVEPLPVARPAPKAEARPRPKSRPAVDVEVIDDQEDDRPRRKNPRRDDARESGWQKYKRSPVRFAVLGVLVAMMLVLAFLLYQKLDRQRASGVGKFATCRVGMKNSPAGR